jgi:RNA polymerase sigma-54 factor
MLKPSIQLRVGQHLAMTPQLQQAIRLLQLSTLELQAEIQETFEQNPMLEHVEDSTDGASADGEAPDATPEPDFPRNEGSAGGDDSPVETSWEDVYHSSTAYAPESERDPMDNRSGEGEGLREHLLWQLRMTNLVDRDRAVATALIDAIDEDGYLCESLESIRPDAENGVYLESDEIEAVLHLIQQFDPVGSGARDLSECLLAQLWQFPPDTPGLVAARDIVRNHLELLAQRNFKRLARLVGTTEAALQPSLDLIQSLNPRPGAQIGSESPGYIVPDVVVHKAGGVWRVEMNPETAPKLRINSLYAGMVKRADQSADNTYLKNQLQEARWFIKSLQSRNDTLLRVATAIVDRQRAFFDYGDEAMKPMVLKDIADQLEMHESTISRVTTQKYMHTPRGVYEFKHFFSSHVGTADGGTCSATAIRAMIRKLIAEEPPNKPLSDNKIASILESKGINVARRTVAKYREAINIPSSSERRRPA